MSEPKFDVFFNGVIIPEDTWADSGMISVDKNGNDCEPGPVINPCFEDERKPPDCE